MSIDVERVTDADTWDDQLADAPGATAFHAFDVLRAIETHADARLHPLVGYKGHEPVGLFPVFEVSKGPVTTVFSPPPGIGVPYMGPVRLNHEKLKRRKRDRRNRRFVEAVLSWLDEAVSPRYTRLLTSTAYDDVRPFLWNDFDVTPRYTYVTPLESRETLLSSFTRDARSAITGADETAYTIRDDPEAVEYVVERINSRHDETDGGLELSPAYARAVLEAAPDARTYVATVGGERVTGGLVVHEPDRVVSWQAAPRPSRDVDVGINELLLWRAMTDGLDADRAAFDLVGANTPRLCAYKAKFAPDPVVYFEVERGDPVMDLASSLYRRLG